MRFDCTVLRNFRNFEELKVNWSSGINLILGSNGSGKTNLLEALSVLSGWGAFARTSSLVSWLRGGRAYVSAKVSGEESFSVTAEISSRVSLRLNEKTISFTDLRLSLPSVIFLTGNLSLIDGSPSSRRLFVDRLCALFVPPFAKRLADFKTVNKKRSILLRQGKISPSIENDFCKLGGWLMDIRREVVRQMKTESFTLKFLPEVDGNCESYLSELTNANRQREIYAQRSLFGPNYDDMSITVSNRPASEALSRGQKRRLILRMIITAGRLIEMRLKRLPVLLLDDLTAELDAQGREWVFGEINSTKWQAFITAPEKPFTGRKKFGGINL